jgi:hypothetical protein
MTTSKVKVAMVAVTHQMQVLITIDFMPLIFSSRVDAAVHQIQVLFAVDFESMIAPFIYCIAKCKHASNRYAFAITR